ncbi:MAG: hypothetical protein QOE82_3117, partial [Thermoanaerobaculia bacterium]|nr:hypothetical protein [Thermoanaerobaculia bacterium]
MKNALVIAAREFEEKRFVAYAALGFAILPFVLAAIPGVSGKNPRDVIAMASLIFGVTFAVAVAVISGASFIGRDLSDGRMSFYFSRPAGSLSIWFGKLTAAILLIAGCFGFIILPGRLAAGEHWRRLVSASTTWSIFYVLTAAVALFLITHVISTFARSRSPLIAFDFAAAVICGVSIRYLFLPLMAGQAFIVMTTLWRALAIAAAAIVIAGGAWQLERGRTDRRRNHLALSQFLWSALGVTLLIAAAYVAWVVSVKPSDLTLNIQATRSTAGPFAIITGRSKGRADYHAAFLLNSDDGSMTRVDPWASYVSRYSRDGRNAVMPRRDGNYANIVIYTAGKSEPVDTGLTVTDGDYFVSDDASRIATISHPSTLSVYDVAQKRSLASVRLPDAAYLRASFVTNDVVRAYLNVPNGMKIVELDVRARGLRETGFIPSGNAIGLYPDPSASHMLVRQVHGDALSLNDASTGAPIRSLVTGTQLKTARYLRDGRIAFIDGADTATVLHILAADGTPQRDIPLGARQMTMFVGDDGTRIVLTDVDAGKRLLEAVNIDRGVIERREVIRDWVPSGIFDPRPPIQPLREVFYADANNHIIAWSPATGA